MKLLSLKIKNLKSISTLSMKLKDGVTLIVGDNKIGKTSIFQAIMFAIYGGVKKNLIRHDQKLCELMLEFEHDHHHYKIQRTFYNRKKSSDASLWIDSMDEPYSSSTKVINGLAKQRFHFFKLFGFIYYTKVNTWLVEQKMKKDQFLLELFDLDCISQFVKEGESHIRKFRKDIPEWYFEFDPEEKRIELDEAKEKREKYTVALNKLDQKISTLDKLQAKIKFYRKQTEGKEVVKPEMIEELENKLEDVQKEIGAINHLMKAKSKILNFTKSYDSENTCPLCHSTVNLKKVAKAIKQDLAQLEEKEEEWEKVNDQINEALKKMITRDDLPEITKTQLKKNLDTLPLRQKRSKLRERMSPNSAIISSIKDELYAHRKIQRRIEESNINELETSVQSLSSTIKVINDTMKANLVNMMNEFMLVAYEGNSSIHLIDGQLYLENSRGEKIEFDEMSGANSEIEIVIFIFATSLNIITGNRVLIMDELFNTLDKKTFPRAVNLIQYVTKKYLTQLFIISHRNDFEYDHLFTKSKKRDKWGYISN